MHRAKNFLIFWLPSDPVTRQPNTNPDTGRPYTFDSSDIDPAATNHPSDANFESLIKRYFTDMCSPNPWYDILQQYTDAQGPTGPCSLGGVFNDTRAFPRGRGSTSTSPLTIDDITNEISKVILANSISFSNLILQNEFFFFLPYKVSSDQTDNFHFWFPISTPTQSSLVIWAFFPSRQSPIPPGCIQILGGGGCVPYPNHDPFADSRFSVISHEQFESVTDPLADLADGWLYNNLKHEIADECEYFGGVAGPTFSVNGDSYFIQDEWSNQNHGCVGFPPAPPCSSAASTRCFVNPSTYVVERHTDIPGGATGTPPGAMIEVEADCSLGDFVTGGGFGFAPGLSVFESKPVLDPSTLKPIGWIAGFNTTADISAVPFARGSVSAVCMNAPLLTTYENFQGRAVPAGMVLGLPIFASCNERDFATGGGFLISSSPISSNGGILESIISSGPFTDASGNGWVGNFTNASSMPVFATIFSLCMKPAYGVSTYTSTAPSPTASLSSFEAVCFIGFATGGGVTTPPDPYVPSIFEDEPNVGMGTPAGWTGGIRSSSDLFSVSSTTAVCMKPVYVLLTGTAVELESSVVATGQTITMTARVSNTAAGAGVEPAPSGSVLFSNTNAAGTIHNPKSCVLLETSAGVSSCTIPYTAPSGPGSDTLTGTYQPDDLTHVSSFAVTTLQIVSINIATTGTGPTTVTVSTDSSGNIIITLTDDATGNTLAQIIYPPGTDFSGGTITVDFGKDPATGDTLVEVSGPKLPPGTTKSVSILADPNANTICVVDSPNPSHPKPGSSAGPDCSMTDPSSDTVLFVKCNSTQPCGNPCFSCPSPCNGEDNLFFMLFPEMPFTRTYNCSLSSPNFFKITGLAFSRVQTLTPRLKLAQFFTDGGMNPLQTDASGNPKVDVVLAGGVVRSTNPGEIVAWVNVTNTSGSPLQSLKLNETLPMDWVIAPPWMPARGGIHVFYANGTSLANETDITQPSTITVSGPSPPQTVHVAIPSFNATAIGHPLFTGQSILLEVKLDYGLDGTPRARNYPLNYTDTANAKAWTMTSYRGIPVGPTSTGKGFFTAYAKVVGDVDGDGSVDITDLVLVWQHQFTNDPGYDVNGDGAVDINDLVLTWQYQFT